MKHDFYLFNTAGRVKELFRAAHNEVGMYCCGPTVYNYAHIGNLRTYIFEDVLKRTLQALGYKVRHVVNITDVGHLTSDEDSGDDKMEKGAIREGKSVWDIAAFYTKRFQDDLKALNITDPTRWPKATAHIDQMISMISDLERKGFTYRTNDGIYFDTTRFPSYCDFAGLDPETLRAGERVEMGEKRAVTDFALWKFSPSDKKRQMEWESPWGVGFPGWHIECSAMSAEYLPLPIDIHCGGADHIRVHHTNEIAQSEAASGKKFVNYWVHGEFLVIDKGKMAKSGENFVTLEVLKKKGFSALSYRMFCYTAHYRNPLSFSWDSLSAAENALVNLRKAVPQQDSSEHVENDVIETILTPFFNAVCDDLNMPRAMAALWDILKNGSLSLMQKRVAAERADTILGLDLTQRAADAYTYSSDDEKRIVVYSLRELDTGVCDGIFEKVRLRRAARANKDFAGADRLRNELVNLGLTVKDLPDGTTEITFSS
ncbi:MAG: cysteine--tRNA ligase [Chitinispirillaceae bacterium]|nr:cysteine--tRNA ligase [Chitinispirillaceae bacterium]